MHTEWWNEPEMSADERASEKRMDTIRKPMKLLSNLVGLSSQQADGQTI